MVKLLGAVCILGAGAWAWRRGLAERSEAGARVRGTAVPLSKKKRPRWGRFLLV